MSPPLIPFIELGAELGHGTHSVVHRGIRDGVPYAVKLPRDSGTEAEREVAYRRFLREAATLARLRHPSLPAVMEVGRASGVPYLIMELAPGETLAERLERGPLDAEQLVPLALQLAGALAVIHAAGLVHRDVRPRNIVLDPRSGVVRLVDLGSSALAHGGGGSVGTRAVAAPEVWGNEALSADGREDLYALGCVLLECTGQRSGPERADGARSAPLPLAPSAEAALDLDAAGIIRRLLASNPNDRYPSATRLLEDLERVGSGGDPPSTQRGQPGRSGPPASVPGARLIGRDAELDRIRRMWAEAQRGSRVLLVQGVAGAGKTRLVGAFLEGLTAAGTPVLSAACHPRDPRAFSAVRQLIEGYLRHCDRLPATDRARSLAQLRRLAGDLGSLLKLLSPAIARVFHDSPTLPASENAEQAFAEGLAAFLGGLFLLAGPLVVVVLDIQWLDASSRRVLARAANQASKARALFLFTGRAEDGEAPARRFIETIQAPVVRLDVSPLEDDAVIAIARDYLSAKELDADAKQVILRLSDGTPLRVLEVLRTLVDEGVLLPHWGRWRLDADAVTEMHLPSHTTSLLLRRIGSLDTSTRAVLTAAAVIGMTFEEDLLASAAGTDVVHVRAALADAKRAQLVGLVRDWTHQFIHHTVREALLSACDGRDLQRIHQRVAEALDEGTARPRGEPSLRFEIEGRESFHSGVALGVVRATDERIDAEPLYRLAFHFASGVPGRAPERVAETNTRAGRAAVALFDNERAIDFFEAAEGALELVSGSLEPQTRLLLAEARLRSGALDEALREFERVLSSTSDVFVQASALARITSIHDMQLDSTRAWEALQLAFHKLGEEPPRESSRYALGSMATWVARGLSRRRSRPPASTDRVRDEMLCALYYLAVRVATAHGKPGRLILAALRGLEPAERLGKSPALAKGYLTYGFVLTVIGFPAAGSRYLSLAEGMARELRDPVVYSHALQVHAVIAAWGGRMQDAIDAGARCLVEYGYWRELGDFCLVCYSQYEMEVVRGRDTEAWKWLDLAIQRVNQHEGAPVVHELLLLGARASLAGLGRDADTRSRLYRLEQATVRVPKDSGFYPATFAPRVGVLVSKMDLGPEFEALVAEFQSLAQNPRRVHLGVVEYYLHVAHARAHACLRARPEERGPLLAELGRALADAEGAAKTNPLFVAHVRAIEGYDHFFHGRKEDARRAFDAAEHLGVTETAPWVLYSVYRGRAHMLRAEGRADAARDQAVLAESVAMEHGSAYRVRWIREEFGLRVRYAVSGNVTASALSELSSVSDHESPFVLPDGSRARRQLRALLRISQARAQELEPDHQPRLVVDELLQALRARRGFLFLTRDLARAAADATPDLSGSELELAAGRDVSGRDLGEADDYDRGVVRDALGAGAAEVEERVPRLVRIGTSPRLSAIAAPLVVDDVTAGVVYLDRPLGEGVFSDADGEVLSALAGQVSVALELTRALRAREQAQDSLRNAEKMDAVARLARGIAHDLNNMLSAIRFATVAMRSVASADAIVGDDIETIEVAIQRAKELTTQLGTFSEGEFGKPQPVSLSARVERLLPVIVGLVGDSVEVEARLWADLPPVMADPSQIDQVVMNLAVNARDAMSSGGRIRIETAEVVLGDAYVREHPRVRRGRYSRLTLTDTGHGMDEDTRQKVFEPYFTTKRERGGTGLGLASVYWIVSRAGGHVDVVSSPGVGTTFAVHLPCAPVAATEDAAGRPVPAQHPRPQTVLLVDEDAVSARQMERTLAEVGCRVVVSSSGLEALAIARQRTGDLDLVISDVAMQGMNGLELARELRTARGPIGVLLLSMDGGEHLAESGTLGDEVEFLQKPVAGDLLVRRVREVLVRQRTRS